MKGSPAMDRPAEYPSVASTLDSKESEAEKLATLSKEALKHDKAQTMSGGEIPFVGRGKELKQLEQAVDSLFGQQEQAPPRVIEICGPPGSGKSRLAKQLKSRVIDRGGYFVSGKFVKSRDEKAGDNSAYEGLVLAMEEMVEQILDRDLDMGIRRRLEENLKPDDALALVEIFPCLERIITIDENEDDFCKPNTEQEGRLKTKLFTRRKLLLLKLFRLVVSTETYQDEDIIHSDPTYNGAILMEEKEGKEDETDEESRPIVPIVILLDDVQWMDSPSCQFISALVRDCIREDGIQSFLLIATRRKTAEMDPTNRIPEKALSSILPTGESTFPTQNVATHQSECHSHLPKHLSMNGGSEQRSIPYDSELHIWESQRIPVQKLQLQDLTASEVDTILLWFIGLPSDHKSDPQAATDTMPLAKLIWEKTKGNTFFTIEFIRMLIDRDILVFSYSSMHWKYDLQKAQALNIAEGKNAVTDLLLDKLHLLSAAEQLTLIVASCLGGGFRQGQITTILENLDVKEFLQVSSDTLSFFLTHGEATETLQALNRIGYLKQASYEKTDDPLFHFCHDLVKEAATNIIADESKKKCLLLRIGECILQSTLAHGHSARCRNDSLFLGVDLCNASGMPQNGQLIRMELARYNLLAGEQALQDSSFALAMRYMEAGLAYLEEESPKALDYQPVQRGIFVGLAECNYCVGNFEDMQRYADRALQAGKRDVNLMLKLNYFKVLGSISVAHMDEALEFGWEAVKALGMDKFPLRPSALHVGIELVKTKRLLRGWDKERLINLPLLAPEERNRESSLRFFDVMGPASYHNNINFLVVTKMRSVRWAVKYGISMYSPMDFAVYAMLLNSALGDVSSGKLYGEVALALAARLGVEETKAKTFLRYFSLIHHWTHPLQELDAPLLYSFRVSMECGETESAMESAMYYLYNIWCTASLPLQKFAQELRRYCYLAAQYQHWALLDVFTQISKSTKRLIKGDGVFQWLDEMQSSRESNINDPTQGQQTPVIRTVYAVMELSSDYLLREEAKALGNASISKDVDKHCMAMSYLPRGMFFRALTFLAFPSNRSAAKRNLREVKSILKALKAWKTKGNPNLEHMICLLEAELLKVRKDGKNAEQFYDDAIMLAKKSGQVHDAGIAHELASLFYSSTDEKKASHHAKHATQFFRDWGASAVVERIAKTRS